MSVRAYRYLLVAALSSAVRRPLLGSISAAVIGNSRTVIAPPATSSDAFALLMWSDFTPTAVTATMIGNPVAPCSAICAL